MPSGAPVQLIRNDYSSTNVTTSAWVQLDSAINAEVTEIEIYDTSGETLILGYGASGAEKNLIYIPPGGNGRIPCILPKPCRFVVKAVSASATSGELIINLWG